jgi:hypothetical protein
MHPEVATAPRLTTVLGPHGVNREIRDRLRDLLDSPDGHLHTWLEHGPVHAGAPSPAK